jgi:hypothetical protein
VAVLLVVPVPPSLEVTALVVLFFIPAVTPLTLTETVQVPLAVKVPPLKVSDVSPDAGVKVPPQEVEAPGVVATCNPDGSASVKPTPVNWAVEFGFVIVKVKVVVPLSGTFDAPKALLIVGGASTVIDALAVPPVPPWFELIAPLTLFLTPALVPVRLTITVHEPLAAIVPPLKVSAVSPGFGENVPQGALAFGVGATCSPEGKASVKETPVTEAVVFGLVRVNTSVTIPFNGMLGTLTDAVPPPDAARPVLASVYVKVVAVGIVAMVKVPL